MAEIMFETFNIPAIYIINRNLLSLYATGRFTGVLVDLEESRSYVQPIFESYCISPAKRKLSVACRDVIYYFMKLLESGSPPFCKFF